MHKKKSAIIVDDDQDTLDVFRQYLELKGIDVVGTGNNGKEGVELYNKHRPDVTITDLLMPQYDGKYVIDEIKKMDPNANIIVVSGYPEQIHIGKHEVTAVFQKPYNINDIMDVINSCKKVESKKPQLLCADCGCLLAEYKQSNSPKEYQNCKCVENHNSDKFVNDSKQAAKRIMEASMCACSCMVMMAVIYVGKTGIF